MGWTGSNRVKSLLTICKFLRYGMGPVGWLIYRKPEYANHWDKTGQRPKAVSDPAYHPLQAVGFTHLPHIDPDEFNYLAIHYKVSGDTTLNLARWNGEIAQMCGRKDDARIWGYLVLLSEEFQPIIANDESTPLGKKDKTFDEGIFSNPLPISDRVPSPVSTSPRGGSIKLPSPSHRSSSSSPVASLRGLAIPLDRVEAGDEGEDQDRIEDLMDHDGDEGDRYRPKTTNGERKILSFVPPTEDLRGLITARTSVSTVVPNRGSINTIVPSSRLSTTTSTPARQSSPEPKKKNKTKNHPSSSSYSDYPDPYGITVSTPMSSASTSRSTTASSRDLTRDPSPIRHGIEEKEKDRGIIQLGLGSNKGTRHNSRDKTATPAAAAAAGEGDRSRKLSLEKEKREEERRRSSSLSQKNGAVVKKDFVGIVGGVAKVKSHKVEKGPTGMGPGAGSGSGEMGMEVYREERCRPLMKWWEASLDEVSTTGSWKSVMNQLLIGDIGRCPACLNALYRRCKPDFFPSKTGRKSCSFIHRSASHSFLLNCEPLSDR